MDAHDLHRAFGGGARLAFAGTAVPQLSNVRRELTHAHQAAGARVGQQLGNVARGSHLALSQQHGPVTGGIEQGFEQVGDGCATGEGVQVADDTLGLRGRAAILAGQRLTTRMERVP